MLGLCLSYKIPGVVTSLRGNAQSATINTAHWKSKAGSKQGMYCRKAGNLIARQSCSVPSLFSN